MVFFLLVVWTWSCTDAGLQPVPPDPPPVFDNLLNIRGAYCAEPNVEVLFPVRVLFLVDQSASLQCTDGRNVRVTALNQAIDELLAKPNTEIAMVGFSSWSREQSFTRDRGRFNQFTNPSGGLGPATDYQGALATAMRIIEQDILEETAAVRARSKYILVFISDGVPEPRCNAGCEDDRSTCADGEDNDGDGVRDGADPDCAQINDNSVHPDNLYPVCNTDREIPEDVYVDMSGICPEYNQSPQILQRVQQLLGLKETYAVGDIRLNTVLLFSPPDVVETRCPGASQNFGYNKQQAQAMMQAMANAGDGVFRDVNLESSEESFLSFDISSVEAEQTLLAMAARNHFAQVEGGVILPDSDGDGLSDALELSLGLDKDRRDSDGDRYSDSFEYLLRKQGFDPKSNTAPAQPCGSDRDGDGDRLLDCEELMLGTDPTLADSDNDNMLDSVEFLAGTEPLVDDALSDPDFDGIVNHEEQRAGSESSRSDDEFYRTYRMLYGLEDLGILNTGTEDDVELRHCYNYSLSKAQMVVTPLAKERGLNRFLIYAFEGPARISGVPREVKVACFEAFYLGDSAKMPESGEIDFTETAIQGVRERLQAHLDELAFCPYFDDPAAVVRADVVALIQEVLPRKIILDQRMYQQEELIDLLERHVAENLTPALNQKAYELFVPLANFRADRHCYRPWELERLEHFLDELSQACEAHVASLPQPTPVE
jgi:hypothetical protein